MDEARRTTRDPVLGEEQAKLYIEGIKRQTGHDLFIFLTDGYEMWFWNFPTQSIRPVKDFHSREALERIGFQNVSKKNSMDVPINPAIVDRPCQIEVVKKSPGRP